MKKILNVLAMAVALSGGLIALNNNAHADWEYVRTGVVCGGSAGEVNQQLFANSDYAVITTEHGHKKVPAPFRIVSISDSSSELGNRNVCVIIEASNR